MYAVLACGGGAVQMPDEIVRRFTSASGDLFHPFSTFVLLHQFPSRLRQQNKRALVMDINQTFISCSSDVTFNYV